MRPRQYVILAVAAGVLLALTLGLGGGRRTLPPEPPAPVTVTAVEVEGTLVGYTADPALVEAALTRVLQELPAELAPAVDLRRQVHTATRTVVQPQLLGQVELEDALRRRLPAVEKGWVITVNGRDVVGVATRELAEQVVREIQDDYKRTVLREAARVDQIQFLESIAFREKWLLRDNVRTPEQAKDILRYGTDKLIFYTVQRGDTLWAIAESNRIQVEDLLRANPGVKPEAMQPGQQISMTVKEPVVHLQSTEVQVYREAIPFPVERREDPDLWPWQTRVLVPGEWGERELTVRIERRDGQEVKREVLATRVLREPGKQVMLRGTRQAPRLGTGSFYWPVQGEITDSFGDVGWRWHSGIDIAAAYGTPVQAVDSGTVVFAAWKGNYGYAVEIDHGEGRIVTLYGHLSAFNVGVGQQVRRGDVIGYVGNTGWSTGPHLHFEVKLDGRAVNPLRFYQ